MAEMDTSRPPQDPVDDAARAYIQDRVKNGASRKELVQELVQRGYDPAAAQQIVNSVASGPIASTRQSGLLTLLAGVAVTIISLALSIGTLAAAVETGGTYVICWGAAIFGIYLIIRGVRQLVSGRKVK